MDIEGRTIWQHAAGDQRHNYVDLCLKHDVILTGIGFPQDMQDGDIVLLKHGVSNVYGVGVIGSQDHCEEFLDVDGWALDSARRVRWVWKNEGEPRQFHRALTRTTTQRLGGTHPGIRDWISSIEDSGVEAELSPLPARAKDVTADETAEFLFQRGVASDSIRLLLDPHGEFLRMARWYWSWPWNSRPSEHETVTHLVVPLLRILGWPPQRIGVETKGRIDVALYSTVRGHERIAVSALVEAKKVKDACLSAVGQARKYADRHPNCRRIIVTDGLRYGVFTRGSGGSDLCRYAYLNLIRPRTRYPIYDDCHGAREALLAMTPEWPHESA